MRDFWDFAWGAPAPDLFVQYNVDAASYTGAARQSAEYYQALRDRKVNTLGVMETTSTRSQEGYNAGMYDTQFARSRWAEVGFGPSSPMAYAVSDGSATDPNYGWDNVAWYGEGTGDYEVGPYKFYGNRYCVDAACSGAARSLHPELCLNLNGGWVPRTWGFDESRDTAAQEVGVTPVDGIDQNTLYKPIFGAPPAPKPPSKKKGSDMDLLIVKGDGFWVKNNQFWLVGPSDLATQAKNPDGTLMNLSQVIAAWSWLPYGAVPASAVDPIVTNALAAMVRKQKQDKQLASVTLP